MQDKKEFDLSILCRLVFLCFMAYFFCIYQNLDKINVLLLCANVFNHHQNTT